MTRRTKVLLVIILALAFAVRLGLCIHVGYRPCVGDEYDYDSIAWNVATHHGYQIYNTEPMRHFTAKRGPSYILFVAGVYEVFGHHKLPVLAIQSLLDVLSCYLAFMICSLLFKKNDVALIGALIYAVYPPFITDSAMLLNEATVNLTVLLGIYGFLVYVSNGELWALCVSAASLAIGGFNKPILYAFPILFALSLLRSGKLCSFLKPMCVQLAIIGIIVSPWVVRNEIVFHKFVPTILNGGFTFWGGTGPANGVVVGGLPHPGIPDSVLGNTRGMSEVEYDQYFYKQGIEVIKGHPGRYAILLLKKIPRLWFNVMHDKRPSKASLAFAAFNLVAMCLAVFGAKRFPAPKYAGDLLVALIIYFTIVHMLFFSLARYALPVYAFLFCFTAAGCVAFVDRFRSPVAAVVDASGTREPDTVI